MTFDLPLASSVCSALIMEAEQREEVTCDSILETTVVHIQHASCEVPLFFSLVFALYNTFLFIFI